MSFKRPRVSVVFATRDRADRVRELLAGLASQTLSSQEFEVIAVDDASVDNTRAVLDKAAADKPFAMTVVSNEVSTGPASARDAGWRAASGEVVAFIDDDCIPTPGWLESGLQAIDLNDGFFVQGRTAPRPDEMHLWGPFSRTIEVAELDPAFHTCNIFYPRALLELINGFDTEAYARAVGGEDSDLGWRAIAAGAKPAFSQEALVYHAVSHLGALGKLRVAARWSPAMRAYADYPELREAHFSYGIFWKRTHALLARAALALALRGRWRVLIPWLVLPYARAIWARGKLDGGGPVLAPYFVLHDLVEVWAVVRGGLRHGRFML